MSTKTLPSIFALPTFQVERQTENKKGRKNSKKEKGQFNYETCKTTPRKKAFDVYNKKG